jgi:hypothetical protein
VLTSAHAHRDTDLAHRDWKRKTGIVINGPLKLDYVLTSLVPAEMTLKVVASNPVGSGPCT